MFDCSKAVDFSHELHRLCEIEADGLCACYTCPFTNEDDRSNCPFGRQITAEDVEIVQKWSDEHHALKKTYLDDFLEKFPKADRLAFGPNLCRYKCYGGLCECEGDMPSRWLCQRCWSEVMPE